LKANAQYTKILDFAGATNGSDPLGSFISDGTFLYGMTWSGGTNNDGTIFKIKPDGTDYLKLFDFDETTTGKHPCGSLFSDGTYLYGMTKGGGANNIGTIFKIKPDGSDYVKLFDFAGFTNGGLPSCSLISDGTFLFGTTEMGGINNYGTLFKIKPDGTGYVKLLDFNYTNGVGPKGSLISDGTFLYGTTGGGGANGLGTIFKIKPDGTNYTNLLNFSGTTNGRTPVGSLIFDGVFLYGMTSIGGTNGYGTIFKIKPDGSGYAKLFDFNVTASGSNPQGNLTFDGTFLYGMTRDGGANNYGTIFKIKPDGSDYTKLLDFAGTTNGRKPSGSFIYLFPDLLGMTQMGGTNSKGVVFKLSTLATNVNENNEEKGIVIFPNPATDIIMVSNNVNFNYTLTLNIYNLVGKLVRTELMKQGQQQISIGDLNNGIYVVEIKSKEWTRKQKLIIQR
jgi:uncharacterized repeat protein (TIGR03803 family)